MAGGNWDGQQNLNGGRVEWPTGPLLLDAGEIPYWVEAWVVQKTTGASQRTDQRVFGNAPNRWTADDHPWKQGDFQAGPALGIALVAAKIPGNPDKSTYYWWVDIVELAP
jgi:hypothetical protein